MGVREQILRAGRKVAVGILDRVEHAAGEFLRAGPAFTDPDSPPSPRHETVKAESASSAPITDPSVVPSELQKALVEKAQSGTMPGDPIGDPEGLYWDPYTVVEQLGFREKPSAITYGTLQSIKWRLPVVGAVINVRVGQCASFCRRQSDPEEPGMIVRLRDRKKHPTRVEMAEAERIEDLLITTGKTDDPRTRPSMAHQVKQVMENSLTYDQANLEIVPDRVGTPAAWYAIDAATIRLADAPNLAPVSDVDVPYCVQIYDNVIVNEWTRENMVFAVRNPRADIRSHGYGTSEIEQMITTVTSLLWGLQYNSAFFSQGSSPKGILNLKGTIPEQKMRQFRRQWYQNLAGVENCLDGSTEVWTDEGARSIAAVYDELGEGHFSVWTGSDWQDARAYKTDEALQVCVMRLDNGAELLSSPGHKFLRDVDGARSMVERRNLSIGDHIVLDGCKTTACIEDLEDTDEYMRMYDLEVFDDRHQFVADGVISSNSWRTPIMNAEGMEWIGLNDSNRDMEFSEWINFLIRVVTSMYSMDPIEVNFKFESASGNKSMFAGANQAKIVESKAKGLRPLLTFLEDIYNPNIVQRINPDFCLEFVGLSSQTPKEKQDLATQQVRTYLTVDELRAQEERPPYAEVDPEFPEGGKLILDPNFVAARRDKFMLEQQVELAEVESANPAAPAGSENAKTSKTREQESPTPSNPDQAEAAAEKALHDEPIVVQMRI